MRHGLAMVIAVGPIKDLLLLIALLAFTEQLNKNICRNTHFARASRTTTAFHEDQQKQATPREAHKRDTHHVDHLHTPPSWLTDVVLPWLNGWLEDRLGSLYDRNVAIIFMMTTLCFLLLFYLEEPSDNDGNDHSKVESPATKAKGNICKCCGR